VNRTRTYAVSAVVMLALDLLWLGVIAPPLYSAHVWIPQGPAGVYFGVLQVHPTTGVVGGGYAQEAGALPTELTGHAGQWA
jgi:hypothetical protein